MKIVLKNINILNPYYKVDLKNMDVMIEDGVIKEISDSIKTDKNTKEYDFTNKYLLPGFFDMHVHLREPGREDEETIASGCTAAAFGGFTGIACMPNTKPAIDSAEVISLVKQRAEGCLVNVYPVAAASVGREGEIISPMGELVEAGAVGFSDDGAPIKTANILKRALEYTLMYGVPVIDHCEDESLSGGAMNEGPNSTFLGLLPIPSVSEEIMVMRDILMTEYTGGKLHIAHISTKNSVNMVREAKKKGIQITAEATPHHFSLTDDSLKTYDPNYKMNPPLRSKEDVEAVLEGLKDGTIDCIASDHAPHSIEEKDVEFELAPDGIIGLETEVGLVMSELFYKKVLSLEQIVEKLAVNPRKILNIPIPKPEAGEKADFTILDVDQVWTYDISKHHSKSINTPFDKRLFSGKAVGVINNGKMLVNNEMIDL